MVSKCLNFFVFAFWHLLNASRIAIQFHTLSSNVWFIYFLCPHRYLYFSRSDTWHIVIFICIYWKAKDVGYNSISLFHINKSTFVKCLFMPSIYFWVGFYLFKIFVLCWICILYFSLFQFSWVFFVKEQKIQSSPIYWLLVFMDLSSSLMLQNCA
jgi:hypothetical protein